jgi:hypothetical protein
MISQSRRERAHSDKAQAMATAPQRPGLGSRTSSAPGGLYKLDLVRNPGSGTKSEHTLVEEDEGSPIVGEPIKRTGFHQEKV